LTSLSSVVSHLPTIFTGKSGRFRMALLLAIGVSPLFSLGLAEPAAARGAPDSFADLAEKSLPAVVNVSTTQVLNADDQSGQDLDELFKQFLDRQNGGGDAPKPRKATSLGSGFIIDPAGYIVTNNHVIENADEITVTTHDNEEFKAKLIGADEKTDLALLKIEAGKPLPFVNWGDSDAMRIGDWVLAIGNPFGLGGSVTAGIVSARQRDINAGPYDDFLQTDASINRGNSGGPMFNMDGGVVGINSAIYSPSGGSVGIGFAIPSNLAKPVIDQLRQYGHPRRGWIGVRIQSVSPELAEGLHLPNAKGALIASVTPGGPAEQAGIKQGDVVLKFDGHDVSEMRGLPRIVAETPVAKSVDVVVWRKGKEVSVSAKVGEYPENEDEATAESAPKPDTPTDHGNRIDSLGLDLASLDEKSRQKYGLGDDTEGVLVVDVDKAGPAAEKDLRAGDVIVEVDQKAVKAPGDVQDRVKAAQDNGYRVVTLLVNRKGDFQWVAVKLGKS
jgi:serine protease Do